MYTVDEQGEGVDWEDIPKVVALLPKKDIKVYKSGLEKLAAGLKKHDNQFTKSLLIKLRQKYGTLPPQPESPLPETETPVEVGRQDEPGS